MKHELVVGINGGVGKVIMFTAVARAYKKQFPNSKLTVIGPHLEVLKKNKDIDAMLYTNELNNFWKNTIEPHLKGKKNIDFGMFDPYQHTNHIIGEGHLLENWCDLITIRRAGVPITPIIYNGEMPNIHISHKEKVIYVPEFYHPSGRPILIIQTSGGPMVTDKDGKIIQGIIRWPRDLPMSVAQQVVNYFAQDYIVIHIRRQDQPALQNCFAATHNFRAICTLLLMSSKRLLIDSFPQHACAGLNLPSLVYWCATSPDQFGYKMHTNILANPYADEPDLKNSIFQKINIDSHDLESPYERDEDMITAEYIIEQLLKMPDAPGMTWNPSKQVLEMIEKDIFNLK